ncbi:MAG TPA: SRPBCC family protein [Kofleriaceae bacterium]|nr:SRPBCC family protein [Kofleriaceae bacterium]
MERDADIRSRIVGPNVPRWERIASLLIGGGLAGISTNLLTRHRRRDRHPVVASALGTAGAYFVARGITGRCGIYRMRAVRKGIEVRRTITIQCSPMEVYDLWRDLRNLPRFMQHVNSVEVEADGTSRWVVQEGPKTLEWRAEITEDTPGRRLRWRSLEGSDIDHQGILDLVEAPGGRGTIVDVRMRFRPPGGLFVMGPLSGFLRKLPGLQLAEELARLRMLIETGELATGARNPAELGANEKIATRVGV